MKVKCKWVPKYMERLVEEFSVNEGEEFEFIEDVDERFWKIKKDNGKILTISKDYFTKEKPKEVRKVIIWDDYKETANGTVQNISDDKFKERYFEILEEREREAEEDENI